MLGAERDRVSKAKPKRFEDAALRGSPLGLVRNQDDRRARGAKPAADFLVERSQALARVDHEQCGIGVADSRLRLLPHAPWKRLRVLVLESGGVDHPEIEPEQLRLPLAPV